MKIHIDFETFSECDLKLCGTWVYSKHPSTEVLCMAWAVDDESPVLWLPGHPFPSRLRALIKRGAIVCAWNSFFEWCIWHHTLQWDALPLESWEDTMVKAAVHNMPLSLDNCCKAMMLPEDLAKSSRGKFLITRLCKPYLGFRQYDDVLYRELYIYCIQDVIAERTVDTKLLPISDAERTLWMLDQKINIRGTYVDSEAVNDALKVLDLALNKLRLECFELSNMELPSTNSRARVMKYLEDKFDYKLPGYKKTDILKALKDKNLHPTVRGILDIRRREGKSSTAKYKKLAAIRADDGRAHGLLQFHGASTGRWGGRMFQPHNLPRPNPDLDPDEIIAQLCRHSADAMPGEPMDCLSTALRGMLIPAPGKFFYVGDYAQIEARALVWLAQQTDTLDVFRSGKDVYKATAAKIYRIPYDQVTKEQRFIGKIATLALGYQGGWKAFIKFAEDFGVDDMTMEFAERIKVDWRAENLMIEAYWEALEDAAVSALMSPGIPQVVDSGLGNVLFVKGKNFLQIILPSGRVMYYLHPSVDDRGNFKYWGTDSFTKQWMQLSMYGGKWAQNICEGVCRDLLARAMLRLEHEGFDMVLSVHDENIVEYQDDTRVELFNECMLDAPGWADGLPIEVDTFIAKRYRK